MRDFGVGSRALAALAIVVTSFVSIWIGGSRILPQLRSIHEQYAPVSAYDAARTASGWWGFDARAFDFYRAHLRRQDRYFVQTPAGSPWGTIDQGTAVRQYAAFWLVPAVQVEEPSQANVVLSYGADPSALGVKFASVAHISGRLDIAVARLAQ